MASQADKDRKVALGQAKYVSGSSGAITDIRSDSSGGGGTSTPASAPAPVTTPVTNPTTTPVTTPVIPVANQPSPYADIAKTLVPYLSPEDWATQAQLYGLPAPTAPIPTQITGEVRNQYMSADRANQALAALENMRTAAGSPDYGPGYEYLKNALGLLSKFGGQGGEGMNRLSYNEFTTALNNLQNSVSGDTTGTYSPYSSLATMFLNPTFTAGELESQTKTSTNGTFQGQYNKKLVV
jgi:hypothetical protein